MKTKFEYNLIIMDQITSNIKNVYNVQHMKFEIRFHNFFLFYEFPKTPPAPIYIQTNG